MINKENFIQTYWRYFLDIENDFYKIRQFVEIDRVNHDSFSNEYLKLYEVICSEIDVVMKQYCKDIDNKFNKNNINQYCKFLVDAQSPILIGKVKVKNTDMIIEPWNNWNYKIKISTSGRQIIVANNPRWWNVYNKIKHSRTSIDTDSNKPYYKLANQENILNALGALFILEMEYYKAIVIATGGNNYYPEIESSIFDMFSWNRTIFKVSNLMYSYVE